MEKQETEMKRKLELKTEKEIGNRNGSKKKHKSLVQCFLHSVLSHVLSHYSCILFSNGYRTGFMSHNLPLLWYCAL